MSRRSQPRICPLIRSDGARIPDDGLCQEEKCMFYRKGYTGRKGYNGRGQADSCWILDGFVGLARTWEIKE